MTREILAETLEEIALLLELKGENPFKIRAYRTGAETVMQFPGDIVAKARENDLKGIKGIGDALQQKLHELASTGSLKFHENLRAEFPPGLFELFHIQGLGPKKIKALYDALGVDSVERLRIVCESGEVASLAGFGKKTAEKLLEAIAFRESNADRFRLGDVVAPVEEILASLKEHPDCLRAEVAGSYRRAKETVHDVDFLVATGAPESVIEHFVSHDRVDRVIAKGGTKASVYLANGLQCDLRAVSNAEFACALAYFTGSKEHNVAMRGLALAQGYTLNEYRLAVREGGESPEAPVFESEAQLHHFLGLDYIAPELRENTGEVEAAAEGDLPRLIEVENLRGTFHNHTTASDGKNTLREMADAAIELGLQYLGIADHSKSSFQANGLDEKRLRDQIESIKVLNREYHERGTNFRVFAGSEVDILKDGSLDFDDELLGELDYVVASVHNAMTLSEAEMTKRLIRAVMHPSVTMLGHLTGRLLLEREPYAVDVPAVIEACAETGTIIELNCNPWRLDMDWRWWKYAVERGVKCSINPDAHRIDHLNFLWFGVRLARKGWLTRTDVINTLDLARVENFLQLDSLS
ncbi:MAG: DNA polymerase/3'-5' exonuclease PolX [Verrucomicrobiales bacterium]|jgi:DNA polymerase (family 10)|nr:DNA polymerase/3'-5' exonuclease PolX [Verrucomicrobiales bacterium]MBP9224815.1 DNA polymerase/3'-5' exonuclease PolX [Verrucomicrobiales bacterium]